MTKHWSHSPTIRQSWKQDSDGAPSARRMRLLTRLASLLLLGIVGLGFYYLLFSPFFHPTVRLYFLTTASMEALEGPFLPFVENDAIQFLASDGSLVAEDLPKEFVQVDGPDGYRRSMQKLAERYPARSDIAMLYLSLCTVSVDGRSYVACGKYDPTKPLENCLAIDEFLEGIRAIPAEEIILFLEPSDLSSPRSPLSEPNRFLEDFAKAIQSVDSGSLWVITSHRGSETSHRSLGFASSIFSRAVSIGLQGAADRNRDRLVDLEELFRFVASQTEERVKLESRGVSRQECTLITTQSNQSIRPSSRVVASAPPRTWLEAFVPSWAAPFVASSKVSGLGGGLASAVTSKEKGEGEAAAEPDSKSWISNLASKKSEVVSEMIAEELNDNINFLPDFLGDRIKTAIGLGQAEEEKPKGAGAPNPSSTEAGALPQEKQGEQSEKPKVPAEAPASQENRIKTAIPELSMLWEKGRAKQPLVHALWRLGDYMEQSNDLPLRPLDFAPWAWKAYLQFMLQAERRYRYGGIYDPKKEEIVLLSELAGLLQLAQDLDVKTGKYAKLIEEQRPHFAIPGELSPSLGLTETLGGYGGEKPSSRLQDLTKTLDASIASSDRKLFDQWLVQLQPEEAEAYYEFHLAKRLGMRSGVPWDVLQRSLQVTRRLEKLASDPHATHPMIDGDLRTAWSFQLQGTRKALDQIGEDWHTESLKLLDLATANLGRVERAIRIVGDAWRQKNLHLCELESLLQWYSVLSDRLGEKTIDGDIEVHLVELKRLSEHLMRAESAELSELEHLSSQLSITRDRVFASWNEKANPILLGEGADLPTTNWVTDALLSTALVKSTSRNRLSAMPPRPHDFEEKVDDEPMPWRGELGERLSNPQRIAQHWMALSRFDGTVLPPTIDRTATESDSSGAFKIQESEAKGQAIDLSAWIRQQWTQLSRKENTTRWNRSERIERLRMAEQGLRLLSARVAFPEEGQAILATLWRLEIAERVRLRRQMMEYSQQDASPEEQTFLKNAIERLRILEGRLSDESISKQSGDSLLASLGPTTLSLIADPSADTEVRWKNRGPLIHRTYLVVDYDASLFEIETPPGMVVYRADSLQALIDAHIRSEKARQLLSSTRVDGHQSQGVNGSVKLREETNRYPLHPAAANLAPTMELASGQELRIPFRIRRIKSGPAESKVIWKLVGADHYVRHEMMVQLPVAPRLKMFSDGPKGSWMESAEGLLFLPRAHQATEYRIGIANSNGTDRKLKAELFVLSERFDETVPSGFIHGDASNEIEQRLGNKTLLASSPEFSLQANAASTWLNLQPGGSSVAGEAAEVPAGDASQAAPKGTPISPGMLLCLTDLGSQQKLWRRIDTRVRHPRGYVDPTYSYDVNSERLEIRLASQLESLTNTKQIPIRGRVLNALPGGKEIRLDGEVVGKDPLTLSCRIPLSAPRELMVELDVDGFPRAFLFRLSCWKSTPHTSIQMERQRIVIASPETSTTIGPSNEQPTIQLRVDSMPGAFESTRDFVEVGWDLDRDREFRGEATTRLHSDRQVDVVLMPIQSGRMVLKSKVEDLKVSLPAPSLRNAKMNLLARLSASNEVVWSEPVEVVSDFDPPRITGVEIGPTSVVAIGTDLEVRVGVDDLQLSGIAKVEVAVSTTGSGKFEPTDAPIACERRSDGSWYAKVPTKPLSIGRSELLARAQDVAGNMSPAARAAFEVLDAAEWEARQKRMGQEITGTLFYSDNPLANAKVTLVNEKGEGLQIKITDQKGQFRFDNPGLGKFKLIGVGVYKNRPRKAEADVEVLPPPAPPLRLQLIAK